MREGGEDSVRGDVSTDVGRRARRRRRRDATAMFVGRISSGCDVRGLRVVSHRAVREGEAGRERRRFQRTGADVDL